MPHHGAFSPRIDRRSMIAGLAATAIGRPAARTRAQDFDPFLYITAMPATTDYGQQVGQPASEIGPIVADNRTWDAYIQLPIKEGQDFHFTCEFDSAWISLRAYGYDLTLEQQMAIVGVDTSIEPYWEETPDGIDVHGGDVDLYYCGHYNENILARARCNAVRKVFDANGLGVTVTDTRPKIEAALLRGEPVFFKSTVDFLDWRAAVWHTPDGDDFPVVLTNDHALTVMGFNETDVIIRDPLGPTSTNTERPWQYTVSWERYLQVIAAQGNDAIAIAPAPVATPTANTCPSGVAV